MNKSGQLVIPRFYTEDCFLVLYTFCPFLSFLYNFHWVLTCAFFPPADKLHFLVLGCVIPLAAHSGSYTGMVGEASNYKECHELQVWCVDKALVNLQ